MTLDPFQTNFLLRLLPEPEQTLLRGKGTIVDVPLGKALYEPGEPVNSIYFPVSGLVSVVARLSDGRDVEAGMVGRNSCAGFREAQGSRVAFTEAVGQIAGRGLLVRTDEFGGILETSPRLVSVLARASEILGAQEQQSVACHAHHRVLERLCRWILTVQDCTGLDILPLTQEYIGQMMGVQRTTISTVASEIQATGAFKVRRGTIHVRDRARLERLACECYGALVSHRARVWDGIGG